MSQTDKPKLEILYDPADVNTHQPAATYNDVPVHVDSAVKPISVLRKYLKLVVRNSGGHAAYDCRARARVLIPDADKGNDNQLRYPSTEQKLLMWDSNDHFDAPIPERSINVDEEARLYIAFADNDFPNQPIVNCPQRYASLGTRRPLEAPGRDGIVVQDSFHTGDFAIEVSVTSDQVSTKQIVVIHVDQQAIATSIVGLGELVKPPTPSSGSIA